MDIVLPIEETDPEFAGLLKEHCNSAPLAVLKKRKIITDSVPVVSKGDAVGRNDKCPCGSGKKYKKCCINK